MPTYDMRTKSNADKGKDQGRRTVQYRASTSARWRNATVLGQGTASGLKLLVGEGPSRLIVDNVAKASTQKGAGYTARSQH